MIDWGHIALGGTVVLLFIVALMRRSKHGQIHVRIDIEHEERPDSGREKTPPEQG